MWKRLTGIFALIAWFSAAVAAQPVADTLQCETVIKDLKQVSAVYAVGNDQLYLVETERHRILKLGADGERLDSLGNQGFGDYQFDTPTDVDATNGLKIYVSDRNNNRIQVYDRRFQYLTTIKADGRNLPVHTYRPGRLTVNRLGELFFYDGDSENIIKYGINGEYESSIAIRSDGRLGKPADLAAFDDKLLLADPSQGVIHILSSNGSYIRFIGGLEGVHAVSVYGNSIWALTEKYLVHLDRRGRWMEHKILPRSLGMKLIDLSVYDGRVYLATRGSLLLVR